MHAGSDAEVGRILAGASLWVRPEGGEPLLVAGRVDGDEAEVAETIEAALRTGRAAGARSASGSRVVAFPAPRGARSVAVLRLDGAGDGTAALAAAHRLRSPAGLAQWQAADRAREADYRATAAATIDRLLATAEAFQRLASLPSGAGTPVADVLDEERRTAEGVAHALHDTAAQSIVAATRYLDAARTSVEPAPGGSRPST
jgi:hypothetical protein